MFYGQHFSLALQKAAKLAQGALIFGYQVKDPERFGVVEFDKYMQVLSLEEKPKYPKSDYAITGLYIFDNRAINWAKS